MTTDLRPFSEWITDHARGTVDDEMTMAIAEVTEAVAHHDKPGTVVLKLKIEPAGNGGRTVATSCTVDAKPPQPGAEQSIFYVGEGGSLHRDKNDAADHARAIAEAQRIVDWHSACAELADMHDKRISPFAEPEVAATLRPCRLCVSTAGRVTDQIWAGSVAEMGGDA